MRSSVVLSALSVLAVASAQADPSTDAAVVNGNPTDVTYIATLPESGKIHGSITAVAPSNGTGVSFSVSFQDLPSSGGPFLYHIHTQPVPSNGNCSSTLTHLDPFNRGEDPPCDASTPGNCQVGDLSGKYGKIQADPFNMNYVDLYTSTQPGTPAFFGNRSFVIHYANKTRIACANFGIKTTNNATSTASTKPTGASSTPSTAKPSATQSANAALGSYVPVSAFFSGLLVALVL